MKEQKYLLMCLKKAYFIIHPDWKLGDELRKKIIMKRFMLPKIHQEIWLI